MNYSAHAITTAIAGLTPCSRARFRIVALAAIALRRKSGLAGAKQALLAAGVSDPTWKNAKALINIYDDLVNEDAAAMRWFQTIHYNRARTVIRLLNARGPGWLKKSGLMSGTDRDWRMLDQLDHEIAKHPLGLVGKGGPC